MAADDERAVHLLAMSMLRGAGGGAGVDGERGRAQGMCQAAADLLGMDQVTITLGAGVPERYVLCSTDADVVALEDEEFTVGDGPAVRALLEQRAVLAADVEAHPEQWPLYRGATAAGPSSGGQTFHGVFALPLTVGDRAPLGVMTGYRLAATRVTDVWAAEMLLVAAAVSSALVHLVVSGQLEDALQPDVRPRDHAEWAGRWQVVNQAMGMVVAQLHVPAAEALLRMRARAFLDGALLHDVATAVVQRRLQLDP